MAFQYEGRKIVGQKKFCKKISILKQETVIFVTVRREEAAESGDKRQKQNGEKAIMNEKEWGKIDRKPTKYLCDTFFFSV